MVIVSVTVLVGICIAESNIKDSLEALFFRDSVEAFSYRDSIRTEEKHYKKVLANSGKYYNNIIEHTFTLGMTDEMVIASIGKPSDVNMLVGYCGIYEQWIYSSTYLYFQNGTLIHYYYQVWLYPQYVNQIKEQY